MVMRSFHNEPRGYRFIIRFLRARCYPLPQYSADLLIPQNFYFLKLTLLSILFQSQSFIFISSFSLGPRFRLRPILP
jgi:hypothetical protein